MCICTPKKMIMERGFHIADKKQIIIIRIIFIFSFVLVNQFAYEKRYCDEIHR